MGEGFLGVQYLTSLDRKVLWFWVSAFWGFRLKALSVRVKNPSPKPPNPRP